MKTPVAFVPTLTVIVCLLLAGMNPAPAASTAVADAKAFLDTYNRLYQPLYTIAQEANWKASTDVSDEHTGQRIGAEQAQAAFVGSTWVIDKARALLQRTNELDDLTICQLRAIWLNASGAPATIPDVVAARVAAE